MSSSFAASHNLRTSERFPEVGIRRAERALGVRDCTVAKLFEEVVAASPNSIALVFGTEQVTYEDLNARANQLAFRLRELGIKEDDLVGCCIERSIDLIVGLVAVLKAGGAYVPIDPDYPKERFDHLLRDSGTRVMLTQTTLASTLLSDYDGTCLTVDSSLGTTSAENPTPVGSAGGLAYVMYTSGSTGRPKGVMIENRSIVRLVRNTDFCNFGPDETFLQFAPVSFDASTLEIWGALLNGGRLVIMPPAPNSLKDLKQVIGQQHVTTLWLTAGLFNVFVEEGIEDLHSLRQFLAGGDVLSPHHVRQVLDKLPNCRVINGYGPTENTTFTCCHSMRAADPVPEPVPIGRPIANTQVYILDEDLRPVGVGVVGELYTAGAGLARGYLNDPDATREKFLPNPFATGPGDTRMYRIGDLARWRHDGTIDFLGRVDEQVKINGHRIEPGEIETALEGHRSIRQCCVIAISNENGSKRLAAFYVARPGEQISDKEVREYLAAKLPDFMIPAFFVEAESFPLTPNGKVDRSALRSLGIPARKPLAMNSAMSELEEAIFGIWRGSLGTDQFGVDDNFFDLGGDSLLLVSVHASLEKTLQRAIPITNLFEFATVGSLARHLGGQVSSGQPVSDAQERARRQRAAFALQRQRRSGK